MNDGEIRRQPPTIVSIAADAESISFDMMSETRVGALLAMLAATKPGGRLLELGTGTGHGAAWLLAGMDATAQLDTVDTDARVVAVARRHLDVDGRVRFHVMDGAAFIRTEAPGQFDLIYADAWPGKFSYLDEALALLRPGGIYIVDDLLPQTNWPNGHAVNIPRFVDSLEARSDFVSVRLAWASGVMVAVRRVV